MIQIVSHYFPVFAAIKLVINYSSDFSQFLCRLWKFLFGATLLDLNKLTFVN